MKLCIQKFKCVMCKQHEEVGVAAEGDPPPAVCARCVGQAAEIVASAARDAWRRLNQAGFGVDG